jgi:hypothetical protein
MEATQHLIDMDVENRAYSWSKTLKMQSIVL